MKVSQSILAGILKAGIWLTCRIDAPELRSIPIKGPLILAVNHINTLDVPILESQLYPRRLIALSKAETWDNPFMGWLFDLFEAIPVRRGEADLRAIHSCLRALSSGDILGVAPEGTRSYDGKLQPGQQGIVLLALHSGAPILPVMHWGGEAFSQNLRRWKKTDFHLRVGRAFTLNPMGERVTGTVRREMTDEIMREMAALLPSAYRGAYSDCDSHSKKYIQYV
jgi:1-acyl-sn-glycerol-3-phosphate acyltransferase